MQSGVKIGIAVVLLIAVSAAGYLGFVQYNKNKAAAASAPAAGEAKGTAVAAKPEPKKNQLDRKDKSKAKPKEISTPADKAEPKTGELALAKPVVPAVVKPEPASKPSETSLAKVDPSKDVDWSKSDKAGDASVPVSVDVKPLAASKSETVSVAVVKDETIKIEPSKAESVKVGLPKEESIKVGVSKAEPIKVAVKEELEVKPLKPTEVAAVTPVPSKVSAAKPADVALTPAKSGESVRVVAQKMTDPNDDLLVPVPVDRKPAPAPAPAPKPVTAPKPITDNAAPGATEEPIRVDVGRPGGAPVRREEPVSIGGGATPVTPVTPVGPTANEEYSVQSGDTLTSIAQKKYGDSKHVAVILKANPSLDPKRLKIGQKLILPPLNKPAPTGPLVAPAPPSDGGAVVTVGGQSTYTVKGGDSFWTISEKVYGNGKYVNLIKEANPKVDSGSLKVGQVLVIPPKPVSTSQPAGAGTVTPVVSGATSRPAGFTGGASMPDPVLKPGEEVYVVQSGDNGFWGIAQKKYGDANLMAALAKANPNIDASRLRVGQKLVIPSLEDAQKLAGVTAHPAGATSRPATPTSHPAAPAPARVRTPARTPASPADDGKPRFD